MICSSSFFSSSSFGLGKATHWFCWRLCLFVEKGPVDTEGSGNCFALPQHGAGTWSALLHIRHQPGIFRLPAGLHSFPPLLPYILLFLPFLLLFLLPFFPLLLSLFLLLSLSTSSSSSGLALYFFCFPHDRDIW